MSGTITAAVVVAGGAYLAADKASDAQKDAANKQADGIVNAQGISSAAADQARSAALSLFNPAFADISTGLNQARGDLLAGRTSAQDILNQAFSQSASTLQTSGQQAMNAILGISNPIPQQQQPQQPQQPANPFVPVTDNVQPPVNVQPPANAVVPPQQGVNPPPAQTLPFSPANNVGAGQQAPYTQQQSQLRDNFEQFNRSEQGLRAGYSPFKFKDVKNSY